jgi:hypothetical protein
MEPTFAPGDIALLIYPEGDCDYVTVVEVSQHNAVVTLPDGRQAVTFLDFLAPLTDDDC